MSLWVDFCGGESSYEDCMVECFGLLLPYYLFIVLLLPFRAYEIRLLPRSYPPRWWPVSHTVKRLLTVSVVGSLTASFGLVVVSGELEPYIAVSFLVRIGAWLAAYWMLASEYKRYQPLTWVGLRGFWLLTGLEGAMRIAWTLALGSDLAAFPFALITSLLELVVAFVAVWIPADLNVNLLAHIQRLLLEHPSAQDEGPMQRSEAVYTLHEDDAGRVKEAFQAKRADTPGWIYCVEEELPFRPKIDVIDVDVVAINRDRHIKTVYRIHTRVTTDSDPPFVVEFTATRRYRELRWLDDRLRAVFDHSSFPEQRASLGNFPPREITQADPFARQVAFREYLRRLSQSPFWYCHEFLDMVGIDPEFDAGSLFESCLGLQGMEQSKIPPRTRRPSLAKPPAGGPTVEAVPWRPPLLVSSSASSPAGSFLATPPPELQTGTGLSVSVPDFFTVANSRVVVYRIVLEASGTTFESKHRFSDFQRLSVHLRDFLDARPSVSLPRLLRIPGLFTSPEEFLEDRRGKLQQYLQSLVAEFPSLVASSRFLRTFFKLPAEVHESFHTDDESHRATPTGSVKWGLEEASTPDTTDKEHVTVALPFFHYSTSAESPVVEFCCRFKDPKTHTEWTRFHSFDDFQKLKADLNMRHAYLVDKIPDFPSSHSFGTLGKLETEGRRRVLSKWLAHVLAEAGEQNQEIAEIDPLWAFIEPAHASN